MDLKCFTNTEVITLNIQRTKKKTFIGRSFSVAGPKLSNQLPTHIKSCDSYKSTYSLVYVVKVSYHVFMWNNIDNSKVLLSLRKINKLKFNLLHVDNCFQCSSFFFTN